MPKSFKSLIGKKHEEAEISLKDWQGRTHYHSPRAAESWDTSDQHLMRFEESPVSDGMKVLANYRTEVLNEADHKPADQVFADRRQRVLRDVAASQQERAQLQPKHDVPFDVDFDKEAAKQRKSWWRRLFSRK